MLCSVALKNQFERFAKSAGAVSTGNLNARFTSPASSWRRRCVLYDCGADHRRSGGRDSHERKNRRAVIGHGARHRTAQLQERDVFTSFPATKIAAARAYQMAGTSPQGIDFAEVHDAFTPFEIISSEDLGFFPPGKGGDAVLDGKTALNGTLPINPSGGLKARGHPVGASGLAQVVEATKRREDKHSPNASSNGR